MARTIVEYRLVKLSLSKIGDFQMKDYIDCGFEPYGFPIYVPAADNQFDRPEMLLQALVYYKTEDE